MYGNDIDIIMPVLIYGEEGYQNDRCIIHIKGKQCIENGKAGFIGVVEINGERFDVRSIDFRDNGSGSPAIIVAGYNKEDMEILSGISGYIQKDFKFVKGNLYKFHGRSPSVFEFAAPASTPDEAMAIGDMLKPKISK